jgi:glycerol-3-phosphate dehydrogenase
MIQKLESRREPWDIAVIGGGATGLGIAVDAASRGLQTLLVEQFDFAKATSSRSTKLIHGGIRYLQQGNIKLVMEALHERGILRQNAPHLVKNQSFIVPNYKWWEGPFYGIGLKVYDWMAGQLGLGASQKLSRHQTLHIAPTLDAEGLKGSVLYYDGQFDDARLAIHLARTAADQGATLVNYCKAIGFKKDNGRISGMEILDSLTGRTYMVSAKCLISATGIFTDAMLKMDDPESESILAPSQGVHLVLDKEFLPGDTAIVVPHTDDGRVLFAVPWHQKVIIGTTDTPVPQPSIEPRAFPEEVEFILKQIGRYLVKDPGIKDIRSMFAGQRPLVKSSGKNTAELSRDHLITVSASGLMVITGGKWTTYRKMAEDAVNLAIARSGLPERPCLTAGLRIHGSESNTDFSDPLYYHGSDRAQIQELARQEPGYAERIHPRLSYIVAEIIWAARKEMCMTVEDALSRRTRALFLDARAAIEAAPKVASILSAELHKDEKWKAGQLREFLETASSYLPSDVKSLPLAE